MKTPLAPNLKLALFGCALLGAALFGVPRALDPRASGMPTMRAMIVGGGPSPEYNHYSISSNVRYVRRLLPPGTPLQTLFATGKLSDATVLQDSAALSTHDTLVRLLLDGREADLTSPSYQKPNLGGALDGPSSFDQVEDSFAFLAQRNRSVPLPLFLYFTGHGSPGQGRGPRYENNDYDLWNEETLSVRDLAGHIAKLPPQVPVTLVMVQCYSGSFGNVLFQDGNPKGSLVARDIAGFFATTKDCVAAGCTSEVNEADYRDFTSYFFAALSGQDRVGRKLAGSDYNADGRVGMDEAYYYSMGRDESIDIPTSTSDVFLRRYVPLTDAQVFGATYADLKAWASPAQIAALEALSDRLHLIGEHRLGRTYTNLYKESPGAEMMENKERPEVGSFDSYAAQTHFEKVWNAQSKRVRQRYPGLAARKSPTYPALRAQVVATLGQEVTAGRWNELKTAYQKVYDAYTAAEKQQIAQSLLVRFTRLGKTIVLAHRLQGGKNEALKARYNHLLKLEGATPALQTKPERGDVKGDAKQPPRSLEQAKPVAPAEM